MSSIEYLISFMSFISALALLPYVELFISPYIPNLLFLPWIVARIAIFILAIIIFPKFLTSLYISYQKSKVRG